jgi:hypothetical protein
VSDRRSSAVISAAEADVGRSDVPMTAWRLWALARQSWSSTVAKGRRMGEMGLPGSRSGDDVREGLEREEVRACGVDVSLQAAWSGVREMAGRGDVGGGEEGRWGGGGRSAILATHFHLLSTLRMTDLYLHSTFRLHGVELNYVRRGTSPDKFT